MNRKTFIAAAWLSAGCALGALAQDTNANTNANAGANTNAAPALDWNLFQTIADNNIFDASRSGRGSRGSYTRRHEAVLSYFTYHGTMDDRAIFTGDGAPDRGYVRVGDLINGFKVMKINLDTVELADPSGALVTLAMDDSMRREDDGPWLKSDQPSPLVLSPARPSGDTVHYSGSAGGATEDSTVPTSINPQLQMPDRDAMIRASSGGDPSSRPRPTGVDDGDILRKLREKREQENK